MKYLITNVLGGTEPRSLYVSEALSEHTHVYVSQQGVGNELSFGISVGGASSTVSWMRFTTRMSEMLGDALEIDVDITMFCCETIFYVAQYALAAGVPVTYHYVTPMSYTFSKDPFQLHERSDICQLPGFVARVGDRDNQRLRHVLALGFDEGRAQKFVERYAWDAANTIALVVDPEFVPAGLQQAMDAAKPWLEEFERTNPAVLRSVSVFPSDIARLLAETLRVCDAMDIVLLGPKTLTLGTALFCNALTDTERLRVRVLTDFAVPVSSRSNGVGEHLKFRQLDILSKVHE